MPRRRKRKRKQQNSKERKNVIFKTRLISCQPYRNWIIDLRMYEKWWVVDCTENWPRVHFNSKLLALDPTSKLFGVCLTNFAPQRATLDTSQKGGAWEARPRRARKFKLHRDPQWSTRQKFWGGCPSSCFAWEVWYSSVVLALQLSSYLAAWLEAFFSRLCCPLDDPLALLLQLFLVICGRSDRPAGAAAFFNPWHLGKPQTSFSRKMTADFWWIIFHYYLWWDQSHLKSYFASDFL